MCGLRAKIVIGSWLAKRPFDTQRGRDLADRLMITIFPQPSPVGVLRRVPMAGQGRKVLDMKAQQGRMALSAALLTGGLVSAVMGAIDGSAQVGWCLGATSMSSLSMLGHCPWCYSALALIAASAAVWPEPSRAPIKI
jgi:hypothetical protein